METHKDTIAADHHEVATMENDRPKHRHEELEYSNAPNAADEEYSVGLRTFLAILSLAIANCCATLSNTTNTIIKFQVIALGGASHASWIANANFLLTLACGPIFGSLADRVGKKWFIVVGSALGVVGAFVCSSADGIYTVIGGQILIGIANAGCIVSVAANQEIIPSKFRPYAFGFAQTINSIAAVLGTFLAGYFAEYATWRWSYRFDGIAYFVSAVSVFLTYRPPPTVIRRSTSLRQIATEVDYIGMLLLAGSLACIVVGLTFGGNPYPWSSATVTGTLVGGCIGLIVFGLFEWKVKKTNALLDHRLFESRNFPILCFVCAIDGMLLLGVNVLFAQEIGDLFSTGAVRIAVILSPYLITSTLGCIPAGIIMGKTKSYRVFLIIALLWCSLFTGLMALLNASRQSWALAFSALFGIGTAVTTVIPLVALTLSVPSYLLGTAGTLSISARALGGLVGVTIFTAIYTNKYAVNLPAHVGATLAGLGDGQDVIVDVMTALASGAPAPVALAEVKSLPASQIVPVLGAIATASAASWKFVWIAIACIILANAISSCFLQSVKPSMTAHVESALEGSHLREQQFQPKTDL